MSDRPRPDVLGVTHTCLQCLTRSRVSAKSHSPSQPWSNRIIALTLALTGNLSGLEGWEMSAEGSLLLAFPFDGLDRHLCLIAVYPRKCSAQKCLVQTSRVRVVSPAHKLLQQSLVFPPKPLVLSIQPRNSLQRNLKFWRFGLPYTSVLALRQDRLPLGKCVLDTLMPVQCLAGISRPLAAFDSIDKQFPTELARPAIQDGDNFSDIIVIKILRSDVSHSVASPSLVSTGGGSLRCPG